MTVVGLFSQNGSAPGGKSKGSGSNPFGAARPREEVLAEKGQDWRELEEKLESAKIREEKPSFSKKPVNPGASQERTEQAWRKPVSSVETNHVEPTETPRSVNSFYYACLVLLSLYDNICWFSCLIYNCACSYSPNLIFFIILCCFIVFIRCLIDVLCTNEVLCHVFIIKKLFKIFSVSLFSALKKMGRMLQLRINQNFGLNSTSSVIKILCSS